MQRQSNAAKPNEWDCILDRLKGRVKAAVYANWFEPLRLHSVTGGLYSPRRSEPACTGLGTRRIRGGNRVRGGDNRPRYRFRRN